MSTQLRTRRAVALLVATPLLLASCGEDPRASDETATRPLVFATFGSAFQEAQEQAFVAPFMQLSGAQIVVDSPTDLSKLKVMTQTGEPEWDVYLAGSAESFAYCGTLFQPLDFTNIDRDDFAAGTVSDCGVPVDTYAYLIAYNTDTYGDHPPTSLADFFDLDRFAGTRAMSADPAEGNLELALLADGVDHAELYPLDYDRAFAKLDTIKAQTTFWSSGAEQVEIMQSGRSDMILAWSGRAFEAVDGGAPFAPIWDQNVYHWASLAIVAGSGNRELAQQFIDYAVSPEPQAAFAEAIAYGAANLRAKPALNPDAAQWDSGDEAHRSRSWSIDPVWWGEHTEEVLVRWTDWISG